MKQRKQKEGFTLMELIIVISIIALLSALAYISFSQYLTEAENTKKQADIDTTQSLIELEILKKESFPSKIQ